MACPRLFLGRGFRLFGRSHLEAAVYPELMHSLCKFPYFASFKQQHRMVEGKTLKNTSTPDPAHPC